MQLPLGFDYPKPNMVCKLKKSIYGLKQTSRNWNHKLTSSFISLGYVQSLFDYSLFVNSRVSHITILLIYVDDIVLTGDDIDEIHSFKAFLDSTFKIKDLGPLQFFLGLEVAHSKKGISLNQRKYALELLDDMGFLHCKLASTPMLPNLKLYKDDG